MKNANPFFLERLPDAGRRNPFSAKAALAFFLLVFFAKGVLGQSGAYYYCGAFQIDRTPEQEEKLDELPELITDQFGNRYFPEELLIDFTALQCIGSGHFALEFAGNFTMEEEQTICQVFTDISALIISQQSGIPIRIQKEVLEDGVLGQARTFWRDDNTFGGCGIENNLIWEHINTDADFGSALLQGYVTGVVSINSSLPGNTAWHTLDMDASGTSPNVQSDFMDLYSVVLHEALHMLGFASRISPDGTPRNGYYSTWDHFLVSLPGEDPLIIPFDDPDCCDAMQYNPTLNTPENFNFNCIGSGQEAVAFQFGPNAGGQVTVWGEYPPGFLILPRRLLPIP